MKVVIIGGVAGGASCAARIRRLDENAEITIYERSGYISYANCGLPYYIGGTISDHSEMTLQTPQGFWKRFRIKANIHHEVMSINKDSKNIVVKNLETGEEFNDYYDKLLIAPGASPIKPQIDGLDTCSRVFTLRTLEDAEKIEGFITQETPKDAVIIGGGFIAIELAENLRDKGINVTIVEMTNQLMAPFDSDMASFIHAEMRKNGVNLLFNNSAKAVSEEKGKILVTLSSGNTLSTDMIALAAGVMPDNKLAREAGLQLGIKGAIVVDEYMQTSVPDIYAAGDAVQIKNYITENDAVILLAGPANKEGHIAADNICGRKTAYKGAMGSSVVKIFNMTAASTGLNEKNAKAAGIDYDKVVVAPSSHAGYYPGGTALTFKLLFEKKTNRVIGAQIVGAEGVDKRIDVIATAIYNRMEASDLENIDLAYAPPYSSAKDPVNMAGYVANNAITGLVKQFHIEQLPEIYAMGDRVTLLDVRTPGEYSRGHADGFLNIPVDELRERITEVSKDKPVYVMCQSALRSYIACRILSQNGYDCYNFSGGYRFYDSVTKERKQSEAIFPCGADKLS